MKRLDRLLAHIDTSGKGIEIAPYFNPALPKRDGHDVLILDVFDTATLRERALDDPMIPDHRINEIEEVDIVGDASNIGSATRSTGLAGTLSHIVSSHNFEHLPNPILFLQGCEESLAVGGVLSMAVPDSRACFDHFRMPTRLADWLEAYHTGRRQPSAITVFDALSNQAMYHTETDVKPDCDLALDDPAGFTPNQTLRQTYQDFVECLADPGVYKDVHCSVFHPRSLELMLRDLAFLELTGLRIREITRTFGHEFFVHLEKPAAPHPVLPDDFYRRRAELLHAMDDTRSSKASVRKHIKRWNNKRLAKRRARR